MRPGPPAMPSPADQHAQPREDGIREALRILLTARAQATTARTAAVNTLKALILGAPDNLRQALRSLSTPRQARRCRSLRVYGSQPVAEQILRAELRRLAMPHRQLGPGTASQQGKAAASCVAQAMPVLLGQPGVGPMSAA